MKPYKLLSPSNQSNCVLFNSPHSGSTYTKKFTKLTDLSLQTLRSSEDLFVDQLFSPVVDFGSFMLSATFPRAFIDLNRDDEELDPLLINDETVSIPSNNQIFQYSSECGNLKLKTTMRFEDFNENYKL